MKVRVLCQLALRKIKEEMDLMSTARICMNQTLRPDQPFHCLRILPSRYTVFGVIGQLNQKLGVSVRWPVALLAGLLCSAAAAQNMYKCKDTAGKITYSGKECELIGLIDAGPVMGRASVQPALSVPARSATPPAPQPSVRPPVQSAAKAPEEPEKRCFTVKTAKGSSTRCNEAPEGEPEKK